MKNIYQLVNYSLHQRNQVKE